MTLFTESFEGLVETANSPESSPGFFQIGYQGDFTFASGLRYIQPVPNTSGETTYVGDFFRSPNATWFLGDANGTISTDNDVPDLNAYIGRDKQVGGDIGFAFPVPVHAVIATVDSMDSITLVAYDSHGKLLTGVNIRSVPVAGWDANVIFAFSDAPIAKVVFTGGNLVLDGLAFDDSSDLFSLIRGTRHDDSLDPHDAPRGKVVTLNGFDLIFGRSGDDKLFGRSGDDSLNGGGGNDKLYGGSGNDTLIGGKGHDKLFGGTGQDFCSMRS
jgi:Ca2+-binding RTX toxin-like protein